MAPPTSPLLPEANPLRIDPTTGLPLPDPYPDYMTCPHCGEAEVEAWCYQTRVQCHQCEQWIDHTPPVNCGKYPFCKRGSTDEADKTTAGTD